MRSQPQNVVGAAGDATFVARGFAHMAMRVARQPFSAANSGPIYSLAGNVVSGTGGTIDDIRGRDRSGCGFKSLSEGA